MKVLGNPHTEVDEAAALNHTTKANEQKSAERPEGSQEAIAQ